MGCNCGKKPKKYNNLDSMDHLSIASQVYTEVIQNKPREEWDEFDELMVMNAYKSLYPNQKMTPTLDVGIQFVTEAHHKFTTHHTKIKR